MNEEFVDSNILNNSYLKNIIELSKSRWNEIFIDKGNFKIGLYTPEFKSVKEINRLEKHNGSEVFILLQGNITILVFDGYKKKKIKLEKYKPLIVNDYHNAYCSRSKKRPICLVIEKDNIVTEFIDI